MNAVPPLLTPHSFPMLCVACTKAAAMPFETGTTAVEAYTITVAMRCRECGYE